MCGVSSITFDGTGSGNFKDNFDAMGILSWFSKTSDTTVLSRLPSGSFTVDSHGRILASTLPQSCLAVHVRGISQLVLSTFKKAQQLQMPSGELIVEYGSLRLTARELRGGAIVFLTPRALNQK